MFINDLVRILKIDNLDSSGASDKLGQIGKIKDIYTSNIISVLFKDGSVWYYPKESLKLITKETK